MDTLLNIKKVSFIFFAVLGLVHIGSSLFIANTLYLKEAIIINKTLDIPFIITSLIYGFTSLRIALARKEKSHRILDVVLACTVIVTFVGLILINILIPDLT
ncbi:hypothetical protein HOE67_03225 [Candidatus Peregrinibacteria bacterium]|jgi:hypothetical protein|nr:hypothetical protein [Candidatus Peregrinibacteria bacterium]MBT4056097.1 hypothetical protein [Candidatus Peregrinibacteria bacterium]